MELPAAVALVTAMTGIFTCLVQATNRMNYHNTLLQCYSLLEEGAAKGKEAVFLPEFLAEAGYVMGEEQIPSGPYIAYRSYVKNEKTGKILVDRVEFRSN